MADEQELHQILKELDRKQKAEMTGPPILMMGDPLFFQENGLKKKRKRAEISG